MPTFDNPETRRQRNVLAEIAAERERQKCVEGWTVAHDDAHTDGALGAAAAAYALPEQHRGVKTVAVYYSWSGPEECASLVPRGRCDVPVVWPESWAGCHWKPKDRRRDLIRAAALLVAEIERLDRAPGKPNA